MKFTLATVALLVSTAAAISDAEIANVKPETLNTVIGEVLKEVSLDKKLNKLLKAVKLNRSEKEVKKFFETANLESARSIYAKSATRKHLLQFFPLHVLNGMSVGELSGVLAAAGSPIETYANFPAHMFSNINFATKFRKNYDSTNRQTMLAALTAQQFAELIKIPEFHKRKLTGAALNHLVATVKNPEEYMALLTPEFVDSLNVKTAASPHPVALLRRAVRLLPTGILNDLAVVPNPADAQHYTAEQLQALDKLQCRLDFSQLPDFMIEHVPAIRRILLAVAPSMSVEQRSKFSPAQWNSVIDNQDGCKLMCSGVKPRSITEIAFTAQAFAEIDPRVQAQVIAEHENPPLDLLSRVTRHMTCGWQYQQKHGLAVLDAIKDQDCLAMLGGHPDVADEDHPLAGLSFHDLEKHEALCKHLTERSVLLMAVGRPRNLEELTKRAPQFCGREDIVDLIEAMNPDPDSTSPAELAKPNIWATMTTELLEALTAPVYSQLMRHMPRKTFELMPVEVRSVIPARDVARLIFLKDLTQEQARTLGPMAFALVSEAHKDSLDLAVVSDAQLPYLSRGAPSDLLAAVPADQVVALGKDRLALLTAKQMASLPTTTCTAIFTAPLIPYLRPGSLVSMRAAQLAGVPLSQLAAFTAEQAQAIGSLVLGDDTSAATVLLAKLSSLNADARKALQARFPALCSSAISLTGLSTALIGAAAVIILVLA